MKSYRPEELFDATGALHAGARRAGARRATRRMSANPHANGGLLLRTCGCPTSATTPSTVPSPGGVDAEATRVQGTFLRDVMKLNLDSRNFRVFSPDENNSNRWQDVFEVTEPLLRRRDLSRRRPPRARRPRDGDAERAPVPGLARGLPAHRPARLLQLLRGVHPHHRLDVQPARQVAEGLQRHPLAAADRVAQLPAQRRTSGGRTTTASATRIPGFIDHVVNKKAEVIRVYLPPDANTLLSVTDHCLRSRNYVNVIVAGKQPAPQWLTMDAGDQALHRRHRHLGVGQQRPGRRARRRHGLLRRRADARDAGRGRPAAPARARAEGPRRQRRRPDEAAAAERAPARPAATATSTRSSPRDKPIIFAFHGYPWLIHRLTYRRTNHENLHVRGYKEEGTTTTPFDMAVLNDLDRFHLVERRDRPRAAARRRAPPTPSRRSATS